MDLIEKDASNNYRLKEDVKYEFLRKLKFEDQTVFVFQDEWENKQLSVLSFIHSNKKGKKVYKASRDRFTEFQKKVIEKPKNNQRSTFADAMDPETIKKLKCFT
jgi:hypothetical protein